MKRYIFLILMIVCANSSFGQTITYTYDNLGRLTQVTYPDSSVINYTYDASGNRITVKINDKSYHSPQTIAFKPITVIYGSPDIIPGAVASSGLPVSYVSGNTLVATIVNGNLHIIGVGISTITASQPGNSKYIAATSVSDTLTVTPAALTVIANNQTRDYGTINPALTLSYKGFVNGDDTTKLIIKPSASTTASISSPPGSYPIQVTGGSLNNYTINYTNGTLTIDKAPQIISFSPLSAKNYGDQDFSPNATASSGLIVIYSSSDTTVAKIVNGNIHIVGSGVVTITANQPGNSNYLAAPTVGQSLIIAKAQLTITANNQNKYYGQPSPVLSVNYSGFVNGETPANLASPAIATTPANIASGAGTYPIIPGGAVAGNYSINYINGTLTVNPVSLIATADDQTRQYAEANPPLTISYKGFVNGDEPANLTSPATASTSGTNSSPVDAYPITPSGAISENYIITYVNGTLTVTPATRTITFNNLTTKNYGDPDFDPGAIASSGETIVYSVKDPAIATIVNGQIHITGVGTTTITATVAANSNYSNMPSETQTFVVIKANQTITFNVIPIQFRGTTYDLSGVIASSDLPVSFTSSDPTIAAVNGSTLNLIALGSAIVTASQVGNQNYNAASNIAQIINVSDAAGDEIIVHKAVSPNGDGINDFLFIEGIEKYPDNKVIIVNRDGVKIYEASGYDNINTLFDGHSSITGDLQQAGTYFVKIEFTDNTGSKSKISFFVLKYH